MRNMIFWGTLLLAGVISLPASANELNVQQHNTHGSLLWHSGSHMLELHSDTGNGIVVTQTSADGLWGLHRGDIILAVDGHRVRQVAELLDRLRANRPAPVKIRLSRSHAQQVVTMPAANYMQLVGTKPPVPPKPPTPDSPPPPPPPPPPTSSA